MPLFVLSPIQGHSQHKKSSSNKDVTTLRASHILGKTLNAAAALDVSLDQLCFILCICYMKDQLFIMFDAFF